MVLNAAVQMLREADELKLKISKFKSGTSMLQERSLWATQQQLQQVYQKVLVLDLDYALDKKVEQDLWNVGFKQQIEALQAISKDRKNPLRSEGQAMLSWVLQAAAGFYLCLLHQICTTFKLDLPFRRRASLLGVVEGWGAGEATSGARLPPPAAARYICQHCLVHLGDLARYRQQLRVAHTFYRHALVVSAHSGQPYNQLALVSWRRGRRLGALYWHVRSLLVRAPFPPARGNLARTLRAAALTNDVKDLPVIPGVTSTIESTPASNPGRLDAHSYVTELIKAMHYIHNVEELDKASAIVDSLNSSLTALIATDSFESMTLIKMACVLIWLVHSSTEELVLEGGALSAGEARAARLAWGLAARAVLALLLPHYTRRAPLLPALPALKVWLQWMVFYPRVGAAAAWSGAGVGALWAALAHTLNMLPPHKLDADDAYDSVPLPEDEELTGFLPLEGAFKGLKFPNHATWDTYGGRIPDLEDTQDEDAERGAAAPTPWSRGPPELEQRERARRLRALGRGLADLRPEHLSYTEEDGKLTFTASTLGGEQLSLALAELELPASPASGSPGPPEPQDESDDEPPPPPPVVISEADFREKVREIRVGILKPQGSLERAREERAMATQEDQEAEVSDESKSEDKKESRRARVNIAMAAIMRKQEETSKQVKFVTPPPTPDSTADPAESKDDKPKTIQPKPIKSLANLPLGRKTGGILSLKDKSAGYPHLVNTEDPKNPEKDEKKDTKPAPPSQNSQPYQKRQDLTSPSWGQNVQPSYPDQRVNFQKNYAIQNAGLSYSPNYPAQMNNQSIKLPVVNPKEIDVRTAALQKQNSRQEMFQDGPKYNYQMSGDKKNFLNDLPPRFANQYRYWQNAQDNQYENKFRDENFKSNSLFNNQPARPWNAPQPQQNSTEGFQQPMWWKPEQPTNFSTSYTQPIQTNFYSPQISANIQNPYSNMSYNLQNPLGQKQEGFTQPNYLQSAIGQPQMQSLQNLVSSPNFNSLNSFNSYAPAVSYDSSMYPQFNNKLGYQPLQMKMLDKPQLNYQGNKDLMDMGALNFGANAMDMQQRNLNFNEPKNEMGGMKNMDQIGLVPESTAGSTYSLFSAAPAPDPAWGHAPPAQSLWSGPGPSPLERLLDQQKQMKRPPTPQ